MNKKNNDERLWPSARVTVCDSSGMAWGTSKEKVLELLDYVKQEYILKPDKKPTFLDL